MTTITASNPSDGDMYMCQANNSLGFDEETTMIEVQRKWNLLYSLLTCFSYVTYKYDVV